MAKAKGQPTTDHTVAQVGFAGTADRFGPACDRLKDNQVVEIGFKIYHSTGVSVAGR